MPIPFNAVVGYSVLGEIISPDFFASVAGADLLFSFGRFFGAFFVFQPGQKPGTQDLHGLFFVLVLGFFVLAGYHQAGRQMGYPDGRVSGIDALAARPGRAVSVNFYVLRLYRQIDLFGFGHDRHGHGAGMHAPGFFGFRHSLHPMSSRFVF